MNNENIKFLTKYITKVLLIIGLIVFLGLFSKQLSVLILPILGALILAYLIIPIVNWMTTKKIPKGTAIILIYLLIILLLTVFCVFVIPKLMNVIKQIIAEIPNWIAIYQGNIMNFVNEAQFSTWSPEFKEEIQSGIAKTFGTLQNTIMTILGGIAKGTLSSISIVFNLFIIFFVAYYAIMDAHNIKKAILWLSPKKWREELVDIGNAANNIIYKYIRGQLIVMIIIAVMYSIIYSIIGLKYAILLGILGGLFNVIPYIGPYIGGAPAVIIGLTGSLNMGIITLVAIIIMQQIDNNLISPRIMKENLGISPLVSVLSILICGEFFGFIGILIAVPLSAIVIIIVKKIIEVKRRGQTEDEKYIEKFET